MELNPAGTPPGPRSFHTFTAAGGRAVVIGGRGRDNSHYADVHLFDTGTYTTLSFLLGSFGVWAVISSKSLLLDSFNRIRIIYSYNMAHTLINLLQHLSCRQGGNNNNT